jgi:hypothetical protein
MKYEQLGDKAKRAIRDDVKENPPNRGAIAALEHEHYTLTCRLRAGTSPNAEQDTARVKEIEEVHLPALKGKA